MTMSSHSPTQTPDPTQDRTPDQTRSEHVQQLLAACRDVLSRLLPKRMRAGVPVVPVVRLSGVIGVTTPLRPGLTLAGCARALDRAFSMKRAKAVALAINSPGGSAAQSHLIYRRIRQLSEEKELPVIAFVEDVAASGGYMIACAADDIVCDPSSIVGSIGVIGASFGFNEAIRRLGIERRVYTAGERKSMLDPFLPEKPEDVARIKSLQADIHEQFIALVRARRANKICGPDEVLFSGEFWAGAAALNYGLVDEIGEIRSTLRDRFGDDVVTPLIGAERSLLGRFLPSGSRFAGYAFGGNAEASAAGFADEIISAIEERATWARFGL